jgi:outer membrane protein assembly factor BamB
MRKPLVRAIAVSALILGQVGAGCWVLGVGCSVFGADRPNTQHPTPVHGWLNWRGPQQDGTSLETGLPDQWRVPQRSGGPGGVNHRWTVDLAGGGTPVIADGRLYALGYHGEGPDLQEVVVCVDAETGRRLWEAGFNDFLSDTAYDRYAIGSPTVDAETGNVYAITAAGTFSCFARDGRLLWQRPMMEHFGRLTFPNGRNGAPLIDDDLVIVRGITSNWGGEGPAMDRFYAFDKKSGQLVWSSGPGEQPKDNSFAMPVLAWRNGKRVFYTGDGSGNLVCVNVRTGAPLWRYPVSAGGFNSSVVLYKGKVIGIHSDENRDSSTIGAMVAMKLDAEPKPVEGGGTPVLDKSAEVWRNDLRAVSSSPVLVGDRLYQVDYTGNLCCVDPDTGRILWRYKLGPDQLHASPLYADGKLYVPLHNGMFFILRPTKTGVTELSKVQLEGQCNGAPAVWNGKVYVFSTKKLYCFGKTGNSRALPETGARVAGRGKKPQSNEPRPKPGPTAALQIVPSEVLLHPGEKVRPAVRGIDANGFVTSNYSPDQVKWAKYIPPTARVRAEMDAAFNAQGELVAGGPSAGAFQATVDGFTGTFRGRILPSLPINENFEGFQLTVPHPTETGVQFAYPPLPWIGARFKWEVRDLDGNKVLAKTLDNIFFQRSMAFIGDAGMRNYTMEADVRSDGNRRTMSIVGLINQRYLIALIGNSQELEVSSNQERIKAATPFRWTAGAWYHLKTRVDVASDGSGVVRAKAWKRGDLEPDAWTIEVPHRHAHTEGSPGLFGFAPQSLFRVYVDNISVTPNGG